MWFGKFIGSIMGFSMAGPIGFILGIYLGHQVDKRIHAGVSIFFTTSENIKQTQQVFFKATFSIMGYIAKSDGRVSQNDIEAARHIMQYMRLNELQVKEAGKYFNIGKQPDFDLHKVLNKLIFACHNNRPLLQTFVELQFQAAQAKGAVSPSKKVILDTICQRLGFAPLFSWQYDANFNQNQHQNQYQQNYQQASIQEAYKILDVSAKTPSHEIKKKYRKLMSQYHPDKLISKGLPEEMIKVATAKTQKIKSAYDQIKKEHCF